MTTFSLFLHSTGTGPFMWNNVAEEVVAGTTKLTPTHLGYPPNDPLPRLTRWTPGCKKRGRIAHSFRLRAILSRS